MRFSLRSRLYALAALIFAIDQLSKYWILNVFDLPRRISVELLPVLSLTMVWNHGVSMGLLQADSPASRWLLTAATLAIALVVGVWIWRERTPAQGVALAMILGGAVGNILDRMRFGAVADFIHLHAGGWSFYIFNVADAGITLGVILLLLLGFVRQPAKTGGADRHDVASDTAPLKD